MQLHIQNHIATLAFDRPEKSNALRLGDWDEMGDHFRSLDENDEVRVIILSGEGKSFTSGIDLSSLMQLQTQAADYSEGSEAYLHQAIIKLQDNVSAIAACRKPVIASISGACIGGGIHIAASCDMRYCSKTSFFLLKEVELGIAADLGALQRLPDLIGWGATAELAYTGRQFDGVEAERLGFINRLFDSDADTQAHVQQVATQIAAKTPAAIQGIKLSMRQLRQQRVDRSLEWIADYNARVLST